MGLYLDYDNLLRNTFKLSSKEIESKNILSYIRKKPNYLVILNNCSKEILKSLCIKLYNEKFTCKESMIILQGKFSDDFIKLYTEQ